MIISADNPIFPYIQFYNTRTRQPVRNVLSYDTITGEGVVVGTQTKVLPHLGNIISTELSLDDSGQPAKAYFKDNKNIGITISIPQTKYNEFGRYITNDIMRAPEHNMPGSVKIRVNFTKEYIDKPDKHISS